MPGRFTFPRDARLTSKREYDAVFAEGRKWVGRSFVCYVARREGQGGRLGIAVSRQVGGAVVRNRVKRYLREYYRTHRLELLIPADVVIVARPEARQLDYVRCAEALDRLFRRGGLLGE